MHSMQQSLGSTLRLEQYELMARKVKEIKGKAVISINDHPAVWECFKDFETGLHGRRWCEPGGAW